MKGSIYTKSCTPVGGLWLWLVPKCFVVFAQQGNTMTATIVFLAQFHISWLLGCLPEVIFKYRKSQNMDVTILQVNSAITRQLQNLVSFCRSGLISKLAEKYSNNGPYLKIFVKNWLSARSLLLLSLSLYLCHYLSVSQDKLRIKAKYQVVFGKSVFFQCFRLTAIQWSRILCNPNMNELCYI